MVTTSRPHPFTMITRSKPSVNTSKNSISVKQPTRKKVNGKAAGSRERKTYSSTLLIGEFAWVAMVN